MFQVRKSVVAKFELANILLEGHCFDEVTGNPPRGLQFILGTDKHPNRYDTIVMANLVTKHNNFCIIFESLFFAGLFSTESNARRVDVEASRGQIVGHLRGEIVHRIGTQQR